MEAFLAMIAIFGFDFAPSGWLQCYGTLIQIAPNTALFSLLGTYYGGDGVTTFAIPDLRGRVPLGVGQGPGLANYNIAQTAGTETTTLTISQLPAHNHIADITSLTTAIPASSNAGTTNTPGSTVVPALIPNIGAGVNTVTVKAYSSATPNTTLAPGTISGSLTINPVGGNQPFSIMQPYLVMNYCIATNGIYPSRS